MKRSWKKKSVAFLVGAVLVGSLTVAAANQGSESNPLVTLSYLNNTVNTAVLKEVDTKIANSQKAFEDKLAEQIQKFTQGGTGQSGSGAAFVVVDVASGKTLTPGVGCEVMLRAGSAQCVASDGIGFMDSTTGGTLEHGQALVKNHLYLTATENRGVKATSGGTKLMVRGSYTIN